MADYNEIMILDSGESTELNLYYEIVDTDRHPATKKIVMGKKLIERNIMVPTLEDVDLLIDVYLFGTDQGSLNSKTVNQEETALLGLNDLATHTLNVGNHSGTYYIEPTSVKENVEFGRRHPNIKKYRLLFKEKNI